MRGAGSSAAAPVYAIWATEYLAVHGGAITYDPIGSGAGMTKIKAREVDFGASDIVASAADQSKSDIVMFPTVITGVVPVVNIAGVSNNALRLTGDVLGRIFLGQITQWDSPEIRALNPGLLLPARRIRLVTRADGSGTTYHFSDYLSRTSPAWKQAMGVKNAFEWPAGTLAVKGSGDIAKTVSATADSISYIDYNYVIDRNLTGVSMKNAAGLFVTATVESFRQAVLHSQWYTTGDFTAEINNLPGDSTWPITMGTYIAVPRQARAGDKTEQALQFVTWAYLNGDALARQAKFVPLPDRVQARAYKEIARVTDENGVSLWSKMMGTLAR
ncbi:phosphate ABC transporter substrate-binding protein PstS [soil metagenome]